MKKLFSWFNDRAGFGDWCGRLADAPVPGGPCWCKVLPCTILFLFCVQAITGFFLWVYYSPSAETAWESVYFLQYEVAGGWLLRAIHHYAAHVLLAVLILNVVQSILTRACRAPRELVFWAAVGLGLCALAVVLTGDLLSWDQNGYAATKTRTGFLMLLPWVGDKLLKIAIGGPGPALGHLTLTRFVALHVGLFGGGFLVLLLIHGILIRRANATQVAAAQGGQSHFRGEDANSQGNTNRAAKIGTVPCYWPAQAWRGAAACLVVMAVVLLLACRQHGVTLPQAGAPLLSPADTDPANAYAAARPEWFLVGVYEFSHLFTGQWQLLPIFVFPGLLVLILLAMPFLAKHAAGQVFNVIFTLALLAAVVGMTYYSLAKDRADPAHQRAIAIEWQQAHRIRELIRHEGIPPTGALALLRSDPKTQGPRLFGQQCATCHDHVGGRGDPMQDVKAEKSSAPNLARYASREWLGGLLDPKRINGPEYFGNTKFRGGKMADYVRGDFSELEAAERAQVIVALSAEAKLPAQQQLDAKDAAAVAEGRKLIADQCTTCHKFHDKGKLGDAPELTGWGSPEWIAGIIRNPADFHYYGKLNDRMPAYAASTTDPAQNTLDPRQIELLVKWLRGDWYEEGARGGGRGTRTFREAATSGRRNTVVAKPVAVHGLIGCDHTPRT